MQTSGNLSDWLLELLEKLLRTWRRVEMVLLYIYKEIISHRQILFLSFHNKYDVIVTHCAE